MFTGLVEEIGSIRALSRSSRGARVAVACGFAGELRHGDSVAVDGACLTVIALEGATFSADASNETLARTTLGERRVGDRVNLERALAAGQRLGGHFVLGHVDAVGRIAAVTELGDARRIDFDLPPGFAPLVVPKGSIAIDGISLTVNEVDERRFWVALIPETLKRTTLGDKRPGERVNLEADVLGKYVLRAVSLSGSASAPLDKAALVRAGFLDE